ncbi:response regulator transcription factor [Micropruina sp.]|uniref:response regulator n=1 Tax=Micropruina sp. TaxID=2737536 RepID=UPI00262B0431|nr:response regulator transcription factor [Micropruina sp.]
MTRILVVDDDSMLQRTLRINLRARGHEVLLASSGRQALASFVADDPELVILDLGLPDLDGVEVLRRIRQHSAVPVIVLSARQQADDKIEALDEGADDYVSKPFDVNELMARVRAAVRRTSVAAEAPETFTAPGLTLDFGAHLATRGSETIHLTPTEWRLLAELARHQGRLVPHEDLLRAVWGPGYGREHHYLRVFANQIRRKIEPDPAAPRHLINEPGLGYRLQP